MDTGTGHGARGGAAWRLALAAAVLAACAGLASRWLGRGPVALEIGAFDGPYLGGPWSGSQRAFLDPQAVTGGPTTFVYRAARPRAALSLPLAATGDVTLAFRARATVRSTVAVFAGGAPVGQFLAGTGPWQAYPLTIDGGRLDALGLAFRPLPLVTGEHGGNPELLVDAVTIEAARGLRLGAASCALVASVPVLLLLFATALGARPRTAAAVGAASGAAAVLLVRTATLPTLLALPRLLPAALLAGLAAHAVLRRVAAWDRRALAALVAAGVLAHGALPFFPDHDPPDIEIHARRARDLGGVPFEYQALLRYGSQLPTASQTFGQATAALGDATLIPYSPLPYVAYYAMHLAGLDLHWALTVLNAIVAMAVAPVLWLAALAVWDRRTAWLAAALYTLDLAVWHHLGRAHAPAVFGNALGVAALCWLAAHAGDVRTRRGVAVAAAVLAVAALGYSSMVVLLGLFGAVLMLFLAVDARALGPDGRRGLALALVAGGTLAGALFYFHYVPGLLHGATHVEAEADLFPGKTVLLFHNESRQSLRVWAAGFAIPLLAGLVAMPVALRRARASAQPVLASWLLAWALVMALKEPALFPKLLRWAKEDQFVSPLLALATAAAVAAIPPRALRFAAIALVVAVAAWLQAADYARHAGSLSL